MSLPEPVFDSRTYREILNEAVRRIPVHNPEWNNHSDSDPGVTLLQLFAFMTESLLYRANRIPTRNRQKFLRVLRMGMRAAQPARGFVAFTNPKGRLEAVTLEADQEVRAGRTPFRTENGLDVLPIDARLFYKERLTGTRAAEADVLYRQLYASFDTPGATLDYYESKVFESPATGSLLASLDVGARAVDGLWLGLFARPGDHVDASRAAIANRTLTIGILPAFDDAHCVTGPDGQRRSETGPALIFETPNVRQDGGAAYRRLVPRTRGNPLLDPALVELTLPSADGLRVWTDLDPLEAGVGGYPPDLAEDSAADRLISWVRIRVPEESTPAGGQVSFRVSWIGINAAQVVQMARTRAELLPAGTGEPDQTAVLANTPVLAETVRLTVNGEVWQPIDDLNAAGPEIETRAPRLSSRGGAVASVLACSGSAGIAAAASPAVRSPAPSKVFTVDRESGEIRFGDGAHGARPPAFAVIQASYAWGGGVEGMVGINAITKGTLPAGLKVGNPVPTWGGDEGETVEEAERRIPGHLRHRDRLVASRDFVDLTWTTPGVSLGRVEVLSLFHPELPNQLSLGVATVMVIPATDSRNPIAPQPDRLFLQTVCEHLAPRRLITTELHVRGPEYIDLWVSVAVEVQPGRDQAPVREAVRSAIQDFLSPLSGGLDGAGWPLGKAVDPGEIVAAAARVSGVAKVSALLFGDEAGERAGELELTGLRLPRLAGLSVVSGVSPVPLADLQGATGSATTAANMTPVPVVPESC
jgi:hypothetical protein